MLIIKSVCVFQVVAKQSEQTCLSYVHAVLYFCVYMRMFGYVLFFCFLYSYLYFCHMDLVTELNLMMMFTVCIMGHGPAIAIK